MYTKTIIGPIPIKCGQWKTIKLILQVCLVAHPPTHSNGADVFIASLCSLLFHLSEINLKIIKLNVDIIQAPITGHSCQFVCNKMDLFMRGLSAQCIDLHTSHRILLICIETDMLNFHGFYHHIVWPKIHRDAILSTSKKNWIHLTSPSTLVITLFAHCADANHFARHSTWSKMCMIADR